MRGRVHLALLGAPLILWTAWLGLNMFGRYQTGRSVTDANGLTWSAAKTELKAEVAQSRTGEIEHITVRIMDSKKQILYEKELQIDWDMGGGGFVKAMQADDDPELEIVYVNRGMGPNFYLDVSNGRVEQKDFKTALPEARKLAENWLEHHAPDPFMIGLYLMLTVFYYILYFPVYWIGRWLIRRLLPRGG